MPMVIRFGFDSRGFDWILKLANGASWRCHRVGPLPSAEPPQIFTSADKANTNNSIGVEWHHFYGRW